MQQHDVIVIGSGMGGMVAALKLARQGKKVAVLESGAQFGGYMNPFARKKFHFDVGLHYIGECAPGETFHRLLDQLGLMDVITFRELTPAGFDRYVFPGYQTCLGKGHEVFRDKLIADFPEERKGLERFFELMRHFDTFVRALNGRKKVGTMLEMIRYTPNMVRYLRSTFTEIVSPLIKSPLLQSVLAAPCGDVGLPPAKVSGLTLFLVLNHYLGGGYYPVGGSGAIRDAFFEALKVHDATLLRGTPVEKILVKQGKAIGIRTRDGEVIEATTIISNVDATTTLGTLVGKEVLSARWQRKVAKTPPSLASLSFFIATDMDLPAHGLTDANIWHYEDVDLDAIYAPLLEGKLGEKIGFFLTAPTLKDPEGQRAPKGTHTLEIIQLAPMEPFLEWQGTKTMKRGEEYNAFKEKIARPVMDLVEQKYLPGLRDHLLHFEVSTPLTNIAFTGSPQGGIYGPAHTPDLIGPFRYPVRAPLKGLYLCGASVLGAGVVPCAISGKMAAAAVLKDLGGK